MLSEPLLRIPIGPFEIHDVLGEGGMAKVWRGVHVQQNLPVAIKVMDGDHALARAYRTAFREEVRAVAGFYHPGIILVFDHGVISPEAAALSGGRLAEGAPYLAMELAGGGSLREVSQAMSWTQFRGALSSLLDALAHAHARGVIHRDIKAANVLLCTDDDLRPGLKLTDFGLAHAVESERGISKRSGTPRYMAPEQFQGRWRDYGPWTDLYALGVLAWELSAGRAPFPERDVEALAAAHLSRELPRHYPRRTVPEGFEAWLLRLLEKEPHRRFQRAADAAAALMALGEVEETDDVEYTPVARVISNPTIALDTVFQIETDSMTMTLEDTFDDLDGVTADHAVIDPATSQAPPHPDTWRRPTPPAPGIQLVGAGLGLYGLRSIPLVDRDIQRDRIWAALGRVRVTNSPRVVLLRGAAGNGKSRLIEWMGERAHELGAATVLRAVHSPMGGGADGIMRMVARHMRSHGLEAGALWRRVERSIQLHEVAQPWEVSALAGALESGSALGSPKQRYVLVQRYISRLARERPVIVWLDDVQWGRDALAFTEFLFEQQGAGAVLVVLTAQEEALAEQMLEASLLENVLESSEGSTLEIGPLEQRDRAELVRRLLNLEGDLARRIEERTGGNPLFAVQLVGDWVQRGALVPGETGFTLREGEREVLPDGLHDIWAGRLERLLSGRSQGTRTALELAAALGQEVDRSEWSEACRVIGEEPPTELVPLLASHRLAHTGETAWWFVHGMLRESLERVAREQGRWASVNQACAEMLEGHRDEAAVPGRLGRHWCEAGQPRKALEPLLQGVRHHVGQREYEAGIALLALFDQAFEQSGLDQGHALMLSGLLARGSLHRGQRSLDEATACADRAVEVAEKLADRVGEALLLQASILRLRGSLREGRAIALRAIACFDPGTHKTRQASLAVGRFDVLLGDLDSARTRIEDVQQACERAGDNSLFADCLGDLADIERLRESHNDAARLYRQAMMAADALGSRSGYAHQLHGLAEVTRLAGRFDEATQLYKEFIEIQATLGVTGIQMAHFNLGLIELQQGQFSRARTHHEKVRAAWESQGALGWVGLVDVALLASYAALEDWFFWPSTLRSAQKSLEGGMVDVDIAWPAELAGDLAAERGFFKEAREGWTIARDQWTALGKPDKAAAVGRRMASLDD